jgi:hypothetical protein
MKTSILTIVILTVLVLTSCNDISKQEKPAETTSNVSNSKMENGDDVLIGSWVQPNPINEKEVQGFELKKDGSAGSINMATLVFMKWWSENGKLTLVAESIGNGSSSIDTTIYEIIKNTDKELELKQGDYIEKYTKK